MAMATLPDPLDPPLTPAEFARLGWITARFPLAWVRTGRRRRLLLLALAAPGFFTVFATPLHRSLALLALGLVLFAASVAFRRWSEPLCARAEAAALWPPPTPPMETRSHA